ncbi:MAG: Na+/H+ antiporter NhaA [Myxococcota bacterium]|nr:Na+/H+ antiporter NhaA [Myxococcota bacterium]MDW8361033.1 Na+/H+ antiporter NhaA [Myxococcales bacterium]
MDLHRIRALLVRPFERFFRTEALGGTVLVLATIAALLWANSPWADSYRALWSTELTIGTPRFGLTKPLLIWINDLLMAVFFLVVGLEIKREILIGELRSARRAIVPVLAALGGMAVPAAFFLAVAREGDAVRGWGIPMATDIAFALGCMRMLGARVPPALVVFLTALAIIDDLGAILVIALFYSSGLGAAPLLVAAGCTLLLVVLNLAGVRRPSLYVVAGLPLWVAVLKSGIHPTIAGVVVGLCVPARALYSRRDVVEQARELVGYAEAGGAEQQDEALRALENRLDECESPLSRLEHALHPWVAFVIVPLFALANAGVSLDGVGLGALGQPVALGVLLGLFFGKQLGIFGATWLAVRLGIGALPTGAGWRQLWGASLLGGIGFTMSLFIASLAYGEGSAEHVSAKIGILVGSLLSAVAGVIVLATGPRTAAHGPRGETGPGG